MLEDYISHIFCQTESCFMSHMTFRAFERTRGRDQNFTKTKIKYFFRFIRLAMLKMFFFFFFFFFFFCILYAPDCVPISNALSRGDTQRAKFKQVRRFTEKLKKRVYAVHSLIWRHSVQNKIFNLKNEQWRVFIFQVQQDWRVKYSVAMSDSCEHWGSTPGPNVMVWESRARMKLPTF